MKGHRAAPICPTSGGRCALHAGVPSRRTGGSAPSTPFEEPDEQLRRRCSQHPGDYLRSVVESPIPDDVPKRPHRPGLLVDRPEDQPLDARTYDRTGTHRARLKCDHQRAVIEPPVSATAGGGPERNDLGMAGWIVLGLTGVAAASDHGPICVEDNGSDGDIVGYQRSPRLIERCTHRCEVGRGRIHRAIFAYARQRNHRQCPKA